MVGYSAVGVGLILSPWQGLQGEDFTPLLGAGGNAVGHRGALQLSQYIALLFLQR